MGNTLYAEQCGGPERYALYWYADGGRTFYAPRAYFGKSAVRVFAGKWGFERIVFVNEETVRVHGGCRV